MIRLEEHRSEWADAFRVEAGRIREATGASILAIEHIGSTAVPGLRAKPVIDIAARAAPGIDPLGLDAVLAPLDYAQHRTGPRNHGVHVRSDDGARTHILHVFAAGDWDTCPQRLLRDRLLRDPDARGRYDALKVALAGTAADRRAYTAGKTALVEELVNAERAERGLPPIRVWDK
ncbi:GrpB family protein [Clavibacter michiganensis]|uniref:Dephospho-CoA kinase/protein folding accessory domain-containing protein n=1 Tax=Clavibacter michiganensis TaxID=28447 RepID=A0A251YJK0_9MICO|nr:GrpB family protein [Clavibacter michiganensis]OUE24417.1 dephospho-CoA kinase/protein folding accessory domain-containing protein [Clavibacter michiganensis]